MSTRATITGKGQITIPKEVWQRLRLKQGDQVVFVTENGLTVMKPTRGEANPFERYAGALGGFDTKDEVNAWLSELRDDEQVLTAVNTNVISALQSREPSATGMKELLFSARQEGGLVVCAPVYAELLAYPGAPKDFIDTFLEDTHEVRVDLSLEIWTLSGEAFSAYAERRRKDRSNQPKRLLVNFMVGAHALLMADRLLTLGANRYRTTFPNSRLKPDDALPKDQRLGAEASPFPDLSSSARIGAVYMNT